MLSREPLRVPADAVDRESKQPPSFVTQEQVLMRTASIPGKEGNKAIPAAFSSVIHPLWLTLWSDDTQVCW